MTIAKILNPYAISSKHVFNHCLPRARYKHFLYHLINYLVKYRQIIYVIHYIKGFQFNMIVIQ